MTAQKIAKCPFCKSENAHVCGKFAAYVRCVECDACGPTGIDEGEAIDRWNAWTETETNEQENNNG